MNRAFAPAIGLFVRMSGVIAAAFAILGLSLALTVAKQTLDDGRSRHADPRIPLLQWQSINPSPESMVTVADSIRTPKKSPSHDERRALNAQRDEAIFSARREQDAKNREKTERLRAQRLAHEASLPSITQSRTRIKSKHAKSRLGAYGEG